MSFRPLSLHSQTTGLTLPVVSQMSGQRSSIYRTSAVDTVPTLRVLVKRMGVSRVPSSSIWTRPVVLPKPLMTWAAAGTGSCKVSPGWGSRAVTPVWTSPPARVQWPTVTPGTSLIRFRGPGGRLPTEKPQLGWMPMKVPLNVDCWLRRSVVQGVQVVGGVLVDIIVQPVGIQQVGVGPPAEHRGAAGVVVGVVVFGRRDGQPPGH